VRPSRSTFLLGAAASLGAAAIVPRAAAQSPRARYAGGEPVVLGDDVFTSETWRELRGRRVGIVTNQTGVTSDLESIVDAVRRNPAIALRALYSPEHGLRGDRPAGAYVPSYADPRSGLPVYSLYGTTRRPTAEMLANVDVLLFDIQDVGDRTYTYISTLAEVMAAAKATGKSVWVLDRPNPLGGAIVEGPVLEPRFASFIGLYPIPIRHGMTMGELARLYAGRFGLDCDLRVIAMRGWTRRTLWPATGLAWVPSSPNIPTWQTTFVYPATGLVGAAGLNNATGFTAPFFYAGAFGLDGYALAAALRRRDVPGVRFRPAAWSPLYGFYAGKELTGVELVLGDLTAFRAVRTAVELLVAVHRLDPARLSLESATIDRDWGTDSLRRGLAGGLDADAILGRWTAATRAFEAARAPYLLYG